MRSTKAAAIAAATLLALASCAAPVPHPQSLTADELVDYIDDAQAQQWFYAGTPLEPRPAVRATVVEAPDFDDVMRGCLQSNGVSDIECALGVLMAPGDVGYFGRAELGYLYDYFADSLVPCLAVRGLRMTDMPTRAEFTEQAGFVGWDPYLQLGADLPPSRAASIVADCPRYPEGVTWY